MDIFFLNGGEGIEVIDEKDKEFREKN